MPALDNRALYRPVLTATGLPELLAARRHSVLWLARRTGLARMTVHKAVHGRPVSLLTIVRIAAAMDVSIAAVSPVAAHLLDGSAAGPA